MAAHDRDKAMAGLLRQTLQADAGSQDPCPGPDILAAYYERSLAPDEMPVLRAHISRCARCRAQLSLMARTEAQSPPAARHGWLLDWRLLVAATAALIVVTVWGLHRPALKFAGDRPATQPLVAMSRGRAGRSFAAYASSPIRSAIAARASPRIARRGSNWMWIRFLLNCRPPHSKRRSRRRRSCRAICPRSRPARRILLSLDRTGRPNYSRTPAPAERHSSRTRLSPINSIASPRKTHPKPWTKRPRLPRQPNWPRPHRLQT